MEPRITLLTLGVADLERAIVQQRLSSPGLPPAILPPGPDDAGAPTSKADTPH
jgi:hypothetical protein